MSNLFAYSTHETFRESLRSAFSLAETLLDENAKLAITHMTSLAIQLLDECTAPPTDTFIGVLQSMVAVRVLDLHYTTLRDAHLGVMILDTLGAEMFRDVLAERVRSIESKMSESN